MLHLPPTNGRTGHQSQQNLSSSTIPAQSGSRRSWPRGHMSRLRFAAAGLAAVLALTGCADGPAVSDVLPVTPTDQIAVVVNLTFENVRTMLDAQGNESTNEWSRIAPILTKYHVTGNVYNVEYRAEPKAKSNPPPGMRVNDYTVRMVVGNMNKLAAMHDEIAATRGKVVGDQRIDFAAKSVDITYSTPYMKPELEMSFFGRGEPGASVSLYQPGMSTPQTAMIGQAGIWTHRMRVDPRVDYIYGLSSAPNGQTKYFRINVMSRVEEPLTRESFESLRQSGR